MSHSFRVNVATARGSVEHKRNSHVLDILFLFSIVQSERRTLLMCQRNVEVHAIV